MNLENAVPSVRFEDHTSYSPLQRGLDTFFTKLNPVYAVRQVRDTLLENGTIAPPKRTLRLGMPKLGGS